MWPRGLLVLVLATISTPGYGLHVPLLRRAGSSIARKLTTRATDISHNQHAVFMHNSQDAIYAANITVGGQNVIVNLDTGSTDLWVFHPEIHTVNTTTISANLSYAKGSISGPIDFTSVEFAGFTIPSQAFINANDTIDEDAIFNSGASGLLGLGFDATNSEINKLFRQNFGATNTLGRSPIAHIFYQNMSLPNFFTMLLGRSDDPDDETAGVFTISEYVNSFASVANSPKMTSQTPEHWSVLVDSFKIGGQSHAVSSSVSSIPKGKAVAVLDSGFSLPPIPPYLVDAIYGKLPGAVRVDDVPEISAIGASWIIPCDQMSDVSISIGGVDFPVHPLDLGRLLTLPLRTGNLTFCYNTYQNFAFKNVNFDIILGDAFLKNAYVSFDYGSFDDSGRLTEEPFIQLLPITDFTEAHQEFAAIRAKQLAGMNAPSPAKAKELILADIKADAAEASADEDGAAEISGVLAADGSDTGTSSAITDLVNKYAPIFIGLLAGILLVLVFLTVIGVYLCITRSGKGGNRSMSANYHPVRLGDNGKGYSEPVFETRYDA